jgi:hypothetical protein
MDVNVKLGDALLHEICHYLGVIHNSVFWNIRNENLQTNRLFASLCMSLLLSVHLFNVTTPKPLNRFA